MSYTVKGEATTAHDRIATARAMCDLVMTLQASTETTVNIPVAITYDDMHARIAHCAVLDDSLCACANGIAIERMVLDRATAYVYVATFDDSASTLSEGAPGVYDSDMFARAYSFKDINHANTFFTRLMQRLM